MKRIGVDTNILVYAHITAFPQHAVVRDYLTNYLATKSNILVVTTQVLHEFMHVVTDAKRFEPPVAIAEAIALARQYLQRTNVEFLSTDEAVMSYALELLERHQLGRKRLADTLFAAALIKNSVTTVMTCNVRDFSLFEELLTFNPVS